MFYIVNFKNIITNNNNFDKIYELRIYKKFLFNWNRNKYDFTKHSFYDEMTKVIDRFVYHLVIVICNK